MSREKIAVWLAYRLPRILVYWCAIRLMSAATMPPYGDQIVPELTVDVALKRWDTVPNG